jgi:hypothetical protein
MGTNGLDPVAQLHERQKCKDAPTKKKYPTLDEAEEAAADSSRRANRTIVPYLCPGCGHYHLTGKTTGSDVAFREGGAIKTDALKVRESTYKKPTVAERIEVVPPETIPANPAARRKVLAEFLEGRDSVGTDEVRDALQVSRHTVWKYMSELGWKATRGPGAVWRPLHARLTVVEDVPDTDQLEAAILRHPAGQEWWLIEAFPPGVSVHDYLLTLKTAGLVVEVRARRATSQPKGTHR